MASPFMGVIVDTSTLVAAERRKHSVREIFAQLKEAFGETEAGLSSATLVELAHGLERAVLDTHHQQRQTFLDDLIADIRSYPLTTEIGLLAGRISGQTARHGIKLPFEDLPIGATALHHGREVVTGNARHFEVIPGLVVRTV